MYVSVTYVPDKDAPKQKITGTYLKGKKPKHFDVYIARKTDDYCDFPLIILKENIFKPPKGKQFAGWEIEDFVDYVEKKLYQPGDAVMFCSDLKIYPKWENIVDTNEENQS